MGMAASQARYLGLTARKTNVEYEGQQINQARTALANQSANTFNELLSLEVPTAPSTQDFTTLQYSYKDGVYDEVVTNMSELINDPDGYNYLITHHHYSDVFTGIQSKKNNPQVVMDNIAVQGAIPKGDVTFDGANYLINGVVVGKYDPNDETQKLQFDKIAEKYPELKEEDIADLFTYTADDGSFRFTTKAELDAASKGLADAKDYRVDSDVPTYVGNNKVSAYDPTDPDQKAAYEQIVKNFPEESIAKSDSIYTWEFQGKQYFASYEDLRESAISATDPDHPTENQNKLSQYNAQNVKTKIERQEKAFVDLDDKGRPQSIRFEDSSAVYSLNTETITDEAAYKDAMNQYNYNMQIYEKNIADINAKTEKIQQQDRTLELRLKQLDTEQEALQTEMEAVKKIIDKNIESTFKTFE